MDKYPGNDKAIDLASIKYRSPAAESTQPSQRECRSSFIICQQHARNSKLKTIPTVQTTPTTSA